MKKILFYGNEWEDFKKYYEVIQRMEMEGLEVAVATNNIDLVPLLSVGKLLVVNEKSYYRDLTIYPDGKKAPFKGNSFSFSKLKEVIA